MYSGMLNVPFSRYGNVLVWGVEDDIGPSVRCNSAQGGAVQESFPFHFVFSFSKIIVEGADVAFPNFFSAEPIPPGGHYQDAAFSCLLFE